MIPQAYIIEWSNNVPWSTNEQVEQDLVICRTLVEIFNDDFLAENLAFRGGTALHKLFLSPQPRYSEDIDLVQIKAAPFGDIIDRLKTVLNFIDGKVNVQLGDLMSELKYKFDSEIPPVTQIRLKIETNCREHFAELGWQKVPFTVNSEWLKGECNITTYKIEELLGTKLRALYQRRKGRDLFDLHKAFTTTEVNKKQVIQCFKKYMMFSVGQIPSQKEFITNMEAKMLNANFLGDTKALLRPEEVYDHAAAYKMIKKELIEQL
ncbi:MAG: nucleotidyl transferase AbiEii/AbiGii toxin family protein [Bacteroidota bacterium]|nr:nucleotidyl transferase AbiEii/AbiGii toxin family protein [Bacteroidota bacterium]MDP3146507.1 nucleotidyl transferase AbiEii/AbiGii toxin family protein [Bacteroidota bacterium]MDP3557661.1 nucleotidyl transferase AbiEii/AbiGii toxin family protein [Bacteroidota bacterium]